MKSLILLFLGCATGVAQVLEVPLELKNTILLMDVNINDRAAPNTFIFDTGASTDVLDTNVAKQLGLEANYKQNVPGAGGVESYDIVMGQSYKIQNTLAVNNAYFVLVDLEKLRAKLERNFDGIIGYNVLAERVTMIDYENKLMSFYKSIDEVDISGYKAIPFKFHNGITIPQFDVEITLHNGETFKGRVLFDSGAALSLSVNTPYNQKFKLNKKAGKTLTLETQNLGSKSVSETMAITGMNLGGFELGEMVISISDDKAGVSSYKGYLGILGAEVISRFDVILDYTENTLYLKPNSSFKDAFEFPLSGTTLRKDDQGVYVYSVQKNCPAYDLGMRKGDRVLSIDQNNSGDIEAYRKLLKQEGKTVLIKLKNSSGETKEVTLKLERLL